MRRLATSFSALACVAGVPSRARDERCVGLSVECRESAEASLACAPPSCATSALSASCPPDFPGGADGGQGQFLVGRGNGRDHGVGLRCGVAGAEPAHDVGFRGVGERRHFLHDCGVEGVVGEIAGEVERRALVFAVGVFERGEQFRRLFLASVPRTIPRPAARTFCGMPVLRRALAAATALLFPAAASRASRAT